MSYTLVSPAMRATSIRRRLHFASAINAFGRGRRPTVPGPRACGGGCDHADRPHSRRSGHQRDHHELDHARGSPPARCLAGHHVLTAFRLRPKPTSRISSLALQLFDKVAVLVRGPQASCSRSGLAAPNSGPSMAGARLDSVTCRVRTADVEPGPLLTTLLLIKLARLWMHAPRRSRRRSDALRRHRRGAFRRVCRRAQRRPRSRRSPDGR